jgi:phosphoesterase RecJ-like protein
VLAVTPNQLNEAVAQIHAAQRPLLVTHVDPDGDAIGSLLGLGWALRRLGKTPVLCASDGVPPRYAFLPGADEVVTKPDMAADLIISLDCADMGRLGLTIDDLAVFANKPSLNLDHHVTNTAFAHVNLIDPSAASTAEVVLEVVDALGVPLDPQIATCLLCGVVTDTLGFRTSNVSPRVLERAARLMNAGGPLAQIIEQALNNRPYSGLCMWAAGLGTMQCQDGLIWAHLSRAARKRCGPVAGAETGLVNFLLSAQEAQVAVLFTEREDGAVDVSMRAKPEHDISRVATALNGGGHPQAAGCSLPGPLDEAEAKVLGLLRDYLDARHSRH